MSNQDYSELPKSRKEAIIAGERYFFTGEPCRRGHISKRITDKSGCVDCKNESSKRSRALNPERSKAYREKCADRIKAQQKELRAKNANKIAAYCKEYYLKNREKLLAQGRERRQRNPEVQREYKRKNAAKISEYGRLYRIKNIDSVKARMSKWSAENQSKRTRLENKRRAIKKNAIPGWFSEFDEFAIDEAYLVASERTIMTSIKWHVDHMIPLQSKTACGLHIAINLQVIPSFLNSRKLNRMMMTEPGEWLSLL